MKQSYKHKGYFDIVIVDKKSMQIKQREKIKNLITNSCLNAMANVFVNVSPYLQVKVLAIGDDNTSPTATNTTLNNEVFRTYFVDQSITGTGQATSEFYILDSDYSGTIEELGIFAGPNATLIASTGTLISHALWSYTKSSSEEIYIARIDEIS